MAKFSSKSNLSLASAKKKSVKPGDVTTNQAGGEAYKQSEKLELLSTLLTSFAEDSFCPEGSADRIKKIMHKLKPDGVKFVAKASIYARNVYGMRSITHAAAAVVGKVAKSTKWARKFFGQVVRRPDDICEILAAFMAQHGKPLPNAMKRGLGDAFGKFDEYQLSKYKNEQNAIKLVDAVNLVHPKPNDVNREALQKLVKGELKATETWEAMLSAAGSDAKKKEAAWMKLLKENKLGYMALLRNIRNVCKHAPGAVPELCRQLVNEKQIKKSLVLPFRFLTAYLELQGLEVGPRGGMHSRANQHGKQETEKVDILKEVLGAVASAMDIALANVPAFEGKTAVVLDVSGSMRSVFDKAAVFAAALVKANDADLVLFDGAARYATVDKNVTVMQLTMRLKELMTGGSTNLDAAFYAMAEAKKKYDRIVVISDMQNWVSGRAAYGAHQEYKKKMSADPKVYSFDVSSKGTMQFPEDKVVCITGWSDKVFDVMAMMESNPNAIYEEIEKIPLE